MLVANKTEFQDLQWLGFPTCVIKNSEPENNIVQNLLFIEDNKGYIDRVFGQNFLKLVESSNDESDEKAEGGCSS